MDRGNSIEDKCPTNDFEKGEPDGQCWGDGHYECKNCKHYRADFKRNGQEYIDFAHIIQGGIQVSTL